jgi:hypothetical protein
MQVIDVTRILHAAHIDRLTQAVDERRAWIAEVETNHRDAANFEGHLARQRAMLARDEQALRLMVGQSDG